MPQPFVVKDCALIVRTAGLPAAANLRELRARVEACPGASLYHHFCETKLRASFDDPEYPNDLAVWCAHALHDPILAERLSVLNGFDYESWDALRADTLDILDDRLAEAPSLAWSRPDEQFEFMQAMTVVFDTGVAVSTLPAMLDALAAMDRGSVYFHYLEARRREPVGVDDFSAWLSRCEEPPVALLAALEEIDCHLLSLSELRERLAWVFRRFV